MYYINLFLITSFFGYIIETVLKTFIFHSMNNGILFGPWIPVYGFGSIIILIVYKYLFNRKNLSKILRSILLFIIVSILLTLLEFIGGILIEKLSHKIFWDYSKFKFNFGHYIALETSLMWGVVSILFICFIIPLLDIVIKKTPKYVTILVFLLFIIDLIYAIFQLV